MICLCITFESSYFLTQITTVLQLTVLLCQTMSSKLSLFMQCVRKASDVMMADSTVYDN